MYWSERWCVRLMSVIAQIRLVVPQGISHRSLTIQHCFEDDVQFRCSKLTEVASGSLRVNQTLPFSYLMTTDELDLLKAAASKKDFYFLRARLDSDSSERYMQTFCKAEDLTTDLTVIITVNIDALGKAFGVEVAPVNRLDPRLLSMPDLPDAPNTLVGLITVHGSQPGPSPDLEGYKRKVAKERAEKMAAETGDNRSFLAKYWMYIVPVVLFMLFSGQFGGQGGAGGGAAA